MDVAVIVIVPVGLFAGNSIPTTPVVAGNNMLFNGGKLNIKVDLGEIILIVELYVNVTLCNGSFIPTTITGNPLLLINWFGELFIWAFK